MGQVVALSATIWICFRNDFPSLNRGLFVNLVTAALATPVRLVASRPSLSFRRRFGVVAFDRPLFLRDGVAGALLRLATGCFRPIVFFSCP